MVLQMDMPDDYLWLPGSGKSTLGDLGELAARLGSIVTFDRRGSVYWWDDFENGLSPWFPQYSGTGAGVSLVNSPTFRGDMSCKLTGGNDGSRVSGVLKRLAPALLTTYGLEATFSIQETVERIYITLQYNTGSVKHKMGFQVHVENQKLQYFSDAEAWTDLISYDVETDDKYLFYTFKIVADLNSGSYVRGIINQTEIDLSALSYWQEPDASIPRIEAQVKHVSETGENGIAYVDSVIVTIGDP